MIATTFAALVLKYPPAIQPPPAERMIAGRVPAYAALCRRKMTTPKGKMLSFSLVIFVLQQRLKG